MLPVARQHRGDRLNREIFVEQEHEELVANQLLEGHQREPAAVLVANAAKQGEPSLVGGAVGHPNIEESANCRLSRTSFIDARPEICDAARNGSDMRGVGARSTPRARVAGLEPDQGLQKRRPIDRVEQLLGGPVVKLATALQGLLDRSRYRLFLDLKQQV